MKDLRLFLPLFLLIVLVLLLTGCKGVVPSPGVTEDDTTVTGQILMPYCCLLAEEAEESVLRDKYSGYDCYDETDIWRPAPEALVELRAYDDCKVRYTTFTDETGHYEFTDVNPGLYILTTYCPTDEKYFLKDVIEKVSGEALDAGIPDCDSTSLAMVIEYIGDTYCHCLVVCSCFSEQWSDEYQLAKKIAESLEVNMEVDIPAIIAHEDFGTLCNVDTQGNLIENDLVDMVCSKLQGCCVSPGQTDGDDDDDDDEPEISLIKSANPTTYDEAGDVITYSFTVENTGNVTLTNVTVTDPLVTVVGGPITLDPGEVDSTTFTGSYAITQADVDAGSFYNVATATGTPPVGDNVTDTDDETVTAEQGPAISLIKSASPTTYDEVGDVINYSFTVENTGNVTLTNVTVTDPLVTVVGGPITLDPGEVDSTTFTGSYLITQADLDAGSFYNVATATGIPPVGDDVSDTDDETVIGNQDRSISFTKTATAINGGTPSPFEYSAINDVITYIYVVTNTGNVTLTGVTVTEDNIAFTGEGTIPVPTFVSASLGSLEGTLLPGEAATYTGTYTIVLQDMIDGSVYNLAAGYADCVEPVTDDETVYGNICGSCAKNDAAGCYTIESTATYDPANNTTTFWFKLCNTGSGPECDISHWVYGTETEAEFCIEESDIVSISPTYQSMGYDGSTGYYGIKWDAGDDFGTSGECHEYTIVLHGCRVDEVNDYLAIVKDGSGQTIMYVCGPLCE